MADNNAGKVADFIYGEGKMALLKRKDGMLGRCDLSMALFKDISHSYLIYISVYR